MPESPESIRSRDPLIDAAARTLSDNAELHLAAADFLRSLKTSGVGAQEAISRWDSQDSGQHRAAWRTLLWGMLGLVSTAVLLPNATNTLAYLQWGKALMGMIPEAPAQVVERVSHGLNTPQKLLLLGDLTKDGLDERKEALWRSEPENPAYFAEYAVAFLGANDALPPDFMETARRIDPDNAWFSHLAAAVDAKESVERDEGPPSTMEGQVVNTPTPTWKIPDEARLNRSLAMLREARGKSKCESYSAEMLRQRLHLLPQDTLLENLDSIGCLATVTGFGSIQTWRLSDALAAKAWLLGEAGDADGFLELSKDTEAFLRGTLGIEAGMVLDDIVFFGTVTSIARSFAPAAEKLELAHETARWKAIQNRLREKNEGRQNRSFIVDGKAVAPEALHRIIAGDLGAVMRLAENPPLLTNADLKPGRMIDQEVFSRFFGYVTWLLLGVGLGLTAIYRFRVSVMVRRLAQRTEDLLRPSDWSWILAAGILLPFGYVMAIQRLTPLGGLDRGIPGTTFLLPVTHFLGLLVLWWLVPAVLIRWRLAKRAGFFGFSKPSWMDGLAVLSAAAFVPMIGWLAISDSPGGFWVEWIRKMGFELEETRQMSAPYWAAVGLLAVSVLWLVVTSIRALFGRADRWFHRATGALILTRAHAFAMIVILLATVAFKVSEQFWFERETLMRTDVSAPGWTRYEYLVAVQMRREFRELLGINL